MPSKRDIDRRTKSVKNTRKTTYAMKLVSAAKLKRAQEAAVQSRDFASALKRLLSLAEEAQSGSGLTHPLLESRPVKNIRFLIIGGSRGLAGGYNANVQRRIESAISEAKAEHPDAQHEYIIFGKKVAEYFRRVDREAQHIYEDLSDDVIAWPLEETCEHAAHDFQHEKIDQLRVVYTKFKTVLSMTPVSEVVLPLAKPGEAQVANQDIAAAQVSAVEMPNLIFEPSPEKVFESIIPRIFVSMVRQAAFDAKASEHASRMTAMDSATKNAGELIRKLTLLSNKLRQQKITSELLDIVGGAEAIK